jgi:hypothetical protein
MQLALQSVAFHFESINLPRLERCQLQELAAATRSALQLLMLKLAP